MNIVCIGGGPCGPVFRAPDEEAEPGARHHRGRAQPALRHVRLGRGVLRPDAGQPARRPTRRRPTQILGAFNHWDDIEVNIRGHKIRSGGHGFCGIGRKRLLNILQGRCEELGVKLVFETDVQDDSQFPQADLIIASDGLNSRIRTKLRRDLPARHRPAQLPLRLARHAQAVRGLHLRVRGDRARLVPGARLPVRRRHVDLHRRDARRGLAQGRARQDGEGGVDRVLRAAVRQVPRRPPADVQRGAPARLGAVDPLSARGLRNLGAPQRPRAGGADGRCRAHRAFLDRLGHQAGAGGRDRAGALHRQARPATLRRRCATTRPCAASRCCASRTRRATPPNGSRTSTRYVDLPPEQFAYSLLTRSQRISHENLRLRDQAYVEDYEDWIAERCRAAPLTAAAAGAADVHAVHACAASR